MPSLLCRGARHVDVATAHEGSAIVDADHDGCAVARVGHANAAAEGQRLVRGGERIHVEPLPAGGGAAVEPAAVIAGNAGADGGGGRLCGLDAGDVHRVIGQGGFDRLCKAGEGVLELRGFAGLEGGLGCRWSRRGRRHDRPSNCASCARLAPLAPSSASAAKGVIQRSAHACQDWSCPCRVEIAEGD